MKNIRFFKYHGLGNDFILLDHIHSAQDVPPSPALAAQLCNRNFGVGADGILILTASPIHPSLLIINADGTFPEMCGNGVRCISRHLWERHPPQQPIVELLTPAGSVSMHVQLNELGTYRATSVEMGVPRLIDLEAPFLPMQHEPAAGWRISSGAATTMSLVSMGNPHAIICCDSLEHVPLSTIGPYVETLPIFPHRSNVHFVQVVSRQRARVLTWERGAGATLACGTGACAVHAALHARGQLDAEATLSLPGGELEIAWGGSSKPISMTGPATFVFEGVWPYR